MIIDSIKNNLNIVLHSTVDFTRSKIEKIAKFIFQSSCVLLRCIRDNFKITCASSFVITLAGMQLQSQPLITIGVALPFLNVLLTAIEHSTSESIHRLHERIDELQTEINHEQQNYDRLVTENASQEDLSEFQSALNLLINSRTANIQNCQRKISRLWALRNW